MLGTHEIYNITLNVIVADAFIIGGGMFKYSIPTCLAGLVLLLQGSHLALASAKTILPYNTQIVLPLTHKKRAAGENKPIILMQIQLCQIPMFQHAQRYYCAPVSPTIPCT